MHAGNMMNIFFTAKQGNKCLIVIKQVSVTIDIFFPHISSRHFLSLSSPNTLFFTFGQNATRQHLTAYIRSSGIIQQERLKSNQNKGGMTFLPQSKHPEQVNDP
jgi:hypothetical protein